MLTGLLLALAACAQSAAESQESLILERFRDLPAEEQERVTAAVWAAICAQDHPGCRAAAQLSLHPRVAAAPRLEPDPARAYAADEYAPALKLKTKVWQPDEGPWRTLHRSFFGQRKTPPPPPGRWRWDPGRDALIRPAQPSAPEEDLLAALRGQWPPDGRVQAWALGALDAHPDRNPVADYFEHAYRNREGGIYSGIRLWDVWDSGRTFEVSDVEAIAWLRTIGQDGATVSPIPAARHPQIYARIKASFAEWRDYWTLRQALAVRMLAPWEHPDALFAGATATLDEAWLQCEHDPERMNALLAAHPGRDAFFQAVAAESARLRALPEAPAAWSAGAAARSGLSARIAEAALQAVREEGLLGLRGR